MYENHVVAKLLMQVGIAKGLGDQLCTAHDRDETGEYVHVVWVEGTRVGFKSKDPVKVAEWISQLSEVEPPNE